MKVVEKIEVFSKTALKEAQDKRAQLLPEIHKQYLDACEQITLEANEKYEKTIQEETYKAEQIKSREILQANTDARLSLIELRMQLTNELFDAVYYKLIGFIKTGDYADILVKNVEDTAKQYPEGITVMVCERDLAFKDRLARIEGVEVTQGKNEMLGGFTAMVNGKNIFIDNSYGTKLQEARNSFNGFKIVS